MKAAGLSKARSRFTSSWGRFSSFQVGSLRFSRKKGELLGILLQNCKETMGSLLGFRVEGFEKHPGVVRIWGSCGHFWWGHAAGP